MKNVRRGLGKGMGVGYRNIVPMDKHIHSLSAKGVKTYPDWYAKEVKPIATKGNEKITITCANCNQKISDFKNIFEGKETSYICPRCGYEGFAFTSNTKLNAKVEGGYYQDEDEVKDAYSPEKGKGKITNAGWSWQEVEWENGEKEEVPTWRLKRLKAKGKKYSRQDYKELKELEIKKEELLKKMDTAKGEELDDVEDEYDDVLEKISYIKRGRKGYPDEEEQYWEDRAEAEAVARESGGYITSHAKGGKKQVFLIHDEDSDFPDMHYTKEQLLNYANELNDNQEKPRKMAKSVDDAKKILEEDFNISVKSLNAKRTYMNPLGQDWAVKSKVPIVGLDMETGFDTKREAVSYAKKHKGKVIKLKAQTFNKVYNQDNVIASARYGDRMKFKDKAHRDAVFKVLKQKGLNVSKRVVKGQQLHPEYVEDYEGEVETGFGNTMYQTYFPTLYVIEVR